MLHFAGKCKITYKVRNIHASQDVKTEKGVENGEFR